MKVIVLVSALVLIVLAGTAFAAFLYWGHPYMGANPYKDHPYRGQGSGAFGGCPYLEELHKGLPSPYLDQGPDFNTGPNLTPSPLTKKGQKIIVI